MAADRIPGNMSLSEYLAFDDIRVDRHDYIDGDVFIKEASNSTHALIVTNCVAEIHMQLRGRGFITFSSNMRLQIDETKIIYPDIFVTRQSNKFKDEAETVAINPTFVAEVMSPSSQGYDQGMKGVFYRSLPSINAYLILDQDSPHAQLYTRHDLGWLLQEFKGLDAVIPLEALGCNLKLSEAYLNVFEV